MVAPFTTDPIRVIDMDSHYTEPPGLWVDRAPAKFKERVPKVIENENGSQSWVIDGNVPFAMLGATAVRVDGTKIEGTGVERNDRFEKMSKAAYDVDARLGFLDEHGIYAQIVFPNVSGFGSQRFMEIADDELRLACATIYNDHMADIQKQSGQRLFPQALVPFWNIEHAMAEVKRARNQLGLTGIVMCDSPHDFDMPSLDMPEWAPFWSLCEDLDVAVNFHIGSGKTRPRGWSSLGRGDFTAFISVSLFLDNSKTLTNLIFSGVLLRHPKLKVISVESGIGWVPFLLESMDYQWHENVAPEDKRNTWKGVLPSELFRRNCYVSFWFERWGPANTIEMIGEDNVMFETDFPHPTCLYPEVKEQVAKSLASLRPDVRRKVLHDTAARVYNLPV